MSSSFEIAKKVQNMLDLSIGQIHKVFTSPTARSGSGRQFEAVNCFLPISDSDDWEVKRFVGEFPEQTQ